MVGVATCKTRFMVPLKTRKANLYWAVKQKKERGIPFATRRERAVSLFLVYKKCDILY